MRFTAKLEKFSARNEIMNFLSIKFRVLGIIATIGIILGLLLAFYSPYKAKSLARETLKKDAEFITQLLEENLSLGIQAMILDNGVALQKSLEILQSDYRDKNTAISKVRVFDENLNYITGLNSDKNESKKPLSENEMVLEETDEILKSWSPIFDANNDKIGYVEIEFSKASLNQSATASAINFIIVTIIALAITLLPAFWIVRKLTNSIDTLVDISREVAQGNIDVKPNYDSDDEIGELFTAFSTLVDTTKELATAADAIGQGNYDIELKTRGEKDVLGHAISKMRTNLATMSKETKAQNWLKTGQAELNEKMRGEQDLLELSENIINYIATYIDAKVGAIYLKDESDTLKLVSSYAYTKRKNLSNEFKIGTGIIGQAALEKKPILITNVPDDYIKINSGLGEAKPLNILVLPFLYEGVVKGVIELGSFHELTDLHLQFLQLTAENIAIAFHTAKSRVELKKLLEQSQAQSEELQAQQEKLRVTNEELEEQTQALKESEEELKMQQEELKKANAELEQKTHDLTNQKKEIESKNIELEIARKEIEQKAADLELSSKYKSEFLANMSHELRTPLNSILILSRLLYENKKGNLDEKQVESAQTINSSGSDLLSLINEILDLSKIESGKMIINLDEMSLKQLPIYLKQNLQHVVEEKNLYLKVKLDEKLPEKIITDRQRVEQIIKNLMSNAIKFTHEGGVTVHVYKPTSTKNIKRHDLQVGKTIAIEVTDTGIGIPAAKQRQIFEAFQQVDGTTSRKFGGTGLGLSISRELARILRGEIHLESEEGKGSTFTLFLPEAISIEDINPNLIEKQAVPIEKEKTKAVTDQTAEIIKTPKKTKKSVNEIRDDRLDMKEGDKSILVIEDDQKFAKLLFDMTRENGFKCLIAGDGEAGLQLAMQYIPSAIILDVGLPRADGWMVMERLKNNPETRHIPVYFISGQDKKMEAMQMGAIGYLIKPVNMEEINNAFSKIETIISKNIKKLLVVEDDETMRKSILELIGNNDVTITATGKGEEALKLIHKEDFDCMVLDLGLSDISGFDLLKKINDDKGICDIPIIVYTGKDLTKKEDSVLHKYAKSIIIKGAKSPDRLLDEVSLFLHRVESNLPNDKKSHVQMQYDREEIFKGKKILIVDDDIRNIYAISSILGEKDMEIVTAENGKDALNALQKNSKIDLILMDIMMPEMDGYEAIGKIRQQAELKNVPIIALTAKAMKGDRQKCIDAGANDYLSKPVDVDKLLSLLRVWLYK
jgi:CheY-like chemotaxis protein/GAF domain-containing protein/HAMP domain-containing protein